MLDAAHFHQTVDCCCQQKNCHINRKVFFSDSRDINMQNAEEITIEEKLAIHELRNRVKNEIEEEELLDDIYLFHRFLTARDFNIDKAENMLRKHLEWRKKHDIKNICNFQSPDVIKDYFVYALIGYDKEGYPIRYSPIGRIDAIGIAASLTIEEINKAMVYEEECDTRILKEQSEKLGKRIDKIIYIYDFKSLSFAQVTSKQSLHILGILVKYFLNNYPERLKLFYAINAPVYFNILYSFLMIMLPKKVTDKIRVYSNDSYKADILKIVDADELPAFLGGNQTDPDGNPLCLTKIKQVEGPVPEKYFIHKNRRSLSKDSDVQKVTLSRATFHEVKLFVKEAGSYLEWKFEITSRDIGFGIFYIHVINEEEEENIEVVPLQRIETEKNPEVGAVNCEYPGTYVAVFDNSYSWIRSKEIYYRMKIVTPEEHEAESKQE